MYILLKKYKNVYVLIAAHYAIQIRYILFLPISATWSGEINPIVGLFWALTSCQERNEIQRMTTDDDDAMLINSNKFWKLFPSSIVVSSLGKKQTQCSKNEKSAKKIFQNPSDSKFFF